MKFLTYKIDKVSAFEAIKDQVEVMSSNDLSVFHYNSIDKEILHVVFNIKDEYVLGTKFVGNQLNMPLTQYVNTFYHKKSRLFFIEKVSESYCSMITQFLNTANIGITKVRFSNELIYKALLTYDGFIKQLEMKDEEGNDEYFESVSTNFLLEKIKNNFTITHLLMLSNNLYIAFNNEGVVSFSTTNINFLISFIEGFPYVEISN